MPGSSRTWMAVAGPRFFQSFSTQTTFLSGVTSTNWEFFPPLPREQKMVLPLARRTQLWLPENPVSAGRSV